MPVKKNPVKTNSKSVIEDVATGYFKMKGRVVRVREAHSWEVRTPARTPRGRNPMRRMEKQMASVRLQCENLAPDIFLNIPLDVFNQMQIGKTYEIQCTLVEVEGDNEDA